MSLFSFLRKNKQESASGDSAFYSRAEEDSKAVRSRNKRRQTQSGGEGKSLDPDLPEKKRARRRLIGAVALVLAAVVGLPMILDSEPKPLGDDIAIQIPSKDKPLAVGSTLEEAPAPPSIAAQVTLSPQEEIVEDVAVPATLQAASTPTHNEVTNTAPTAPVANTESTQPTKPNAVRTDVKTNTARASSIDETARAQALLEGKPDPAKSAEKKGGKFIIQVAALASRDKVNELQIKLQNAGIKSYTQKVATQSGDRTRIRVGPFSSKEEAEKVRMKIVKLGLNGTLMPA